MGTVDGFAICICVWDSRMKPRSRGVKGLGGGSEFGGNAICVWRRNAFLGWDDGGCAGCGIRRKRGGGGGVGRKVGEEGVEKWDGEGGGGGGLM